MSRPGSRTRVQGVGVVVLCCLLPPGAESESVQSWVRREEGGRSRRRGVFRAELLVAAEELHPYGDALVPLPRQDADVASVERRLEDVLPVNVVVAVSWKDLQVRTERQKTRVTDSDTTCVSHDPLPAWRDRRTPDCSEVCPHLVRLRAPVLNDGPRLPVVAVRHLEGTDELDGAEVFGPLRDDSRDLLRRLQVHLRTQTEALGTRANRQGSRRGSARSSPAATQSGCWWRRSRRWSCPVCPAGRSGGAR